MPAMEKKRPQVSIHKSPSFSQNGRSPSLDPPAYTTDDLLAAKYQKFAKGVHWTRIILSIATLAVSVSILGCAGHSLHEFSKSDNMQQWVLPVWPLNMDLRPTRAILSCGVIMTCFSLAYLILAMIPLRRKLHTLNIASSVCSFLGLGLSIFTVIFASVITSNFASAQTSGSLISWTCKWQGFESMVPANFTKICNEGSAALDLILTTVILQIFYISASAFGWWVEMMLRRGEVGNGKSYGGLA